MKQLKLKTEVDTDDDNVKISGRVRNTENTDTRRKRNKVKL